MYRAAAEKTAAAAETGGKPVPFAAPQPPPPQQPPPASPSPPAPPKPDTAERSDTIAIEYVDVGTRAKFTASADGLQPLSFQWMKDGRPIPAATQALLTLEKVSAVDAGVYSCVVANPAGSQASPPFRLIVRTP
jgi:hypothetical protein